MQKIQTTSHLTSACSDFPSVLSYLRRSTRTSRSCLRFLSSTRRMLQRESARSHQPKQEKFETWLYNLSTSSPTRLCNGTFESGQYASVHHKQEFLYILCKYSSSCPCHFCCRSLFVVVVTTGAVVSSSDCQR